MRPLILLSIAALLTVALAQNSYAQSGDNHEDTYFSDFAKRSQHFILVDCPSLDIWSVTKFDESLLQPEQEKPLVPRVLHAKTKATAKHVPTNPVFRLWNNQNRHTATFV